MRSNGLHFAQEDDCQTVLEQLTITNYRGFESFELGNLTPVNLIVGKNNSGKTALLEAIHFLASGGNPMVLTGVANRRNEYTVGEDYDGPGPESLIDISHFFHGHEVSADREFSITGTNGLPTVTVRAVSAEEIDDDTLFELRESSMYGQRTLLGTGEPPVLAMKIERGASTEEGRTFLLSEEGALLLDPRRSRRMRPWFDEKRNGPEIVYISPDGSMTELLARMWDLVLRGKREDEVRTAMQILEPDLQDIVFQASDSSRRYRSATGILVGFSEDRTRIPLGSMGDGMRRLLGLSLSLLHAKSGFLLIDEIDTGFHYSIMAKMWELVVKTAVNSGTQVFATTHSADCVRGLGAFCRESPDLAQKVSAHKIERDLQKSVDFDGADVLSAVEQDIEIR